MQQHRFYIYIFSEQPVFAPGNILANSFCMPWSQAYSLLDLLYNTSIFLFRKVFASGDTTLVKEALSVGFCPNKSLHPSNVCVLFINKYLNLLACNSPKNMHSPLQFNTSNHLFTWKIALWMIASQSILLWQAVKHDVQQGELKLRLLFQTHIFPQLWTQRE